MSQTKTEETKSDVAKNGMAVVACIDAMFDKHTHTHTFGVSRKNAIIDSNICRVSWKKLSWKKGVMEKVSWIGVVETVRYAASWRRCRGKHGRHGKRHGSHEA